MEYVAVGVIAVLLGVVYAALIYVVNRFFAKEVEGLVWLEVVFGVGLTLGIGGVADIAIGIPASWPWILALFAATGGPMIVACLIRHGVMAYRQRQRDRELELEEAHGRTLG